MKANLPPIHIVGAGLAGSECALQLADMGYEVVLIEMRSGEVSTAAHKTDKCAELVCSNSFGSLSASSAPGQLKWEAENLNSKILQAAWKARVPAGQALGMDRDVFANQVTHLIHSHPKIKFENRVVNDLSEVPRPCVIATGPLTHEALALSLAKHLGDQFLYFFDAIAPIIDVDSINMDIAWKAARWDKGTKDYINCPLNKQEYFSFVEAIQQARKIEPKDFEKDTPFFENCMPIEEMISRGVLTPRFGPMSGKGLRDPRTGNNPFAVVQLRQDNLEGTAFNMVGFQTKMAYPEQQRVFRMIPGLENAEFLKLGSIHRNLFINTPLRLNDDLSSKSDSLLFFAGQITGVEGYFESTCMGLMVARFVDQKLNGMLAADGSNAKSFYPPRSTAIGSLLAAIRDQTKADHFQPTNINFGHMPPAEIPEPPPKPNGRRVKIDKLDKRQWQIDRARSDFKQWLESSGGQLKASSIVDEATELILATAAAASVAASMAVVAVNSEMAAAPVAAEEA
jgi:methylenetetrahydrofolate--tRNA-(uracil-5-)-methyltransferase